MELGWLWGRGGRGCRSRGQGQEQRCQQRPEEQRRDPPRLCTGVGLPATGAQSDGLNSVTGYTLTSRSFRPTPLQGLPYSIYPSTQLPSCPLLQEASLRDPAGPDPRHTVVPHGVDLQNLPPPRPLLPRELLQADAHPTPVQDTGPSPGASRKPADQGGWSSR